MQNGVMNNWYVYMLRCADNSLYTGITTELARRLHEHNHDNRKGAAYTRGRRPVSLVYYEAHAGRAEAARREYAIRRMRRPEKESLISGKSIPAG